MVTSVLYDQFQALNKDFQHNISHSGEFQGSIRKFRRRHQALCESVNNADQFMMISNVAGFCCQIINLILIVYCTIFFGGVTVGHDAMSAIMYVYWIASTLFGLTLTACQGIAINHAVGYKKGKVFPYSLPIIGPGADPGVRAVSPLVTLSHPPSVRLPLLSTRPAVTFPAAELQLIGRYQIILLGKRGTCV